MLVHQPGFRYFTSRVIPYRTRIKQLHEGSTLLLTTVEVDFKSGEDLEAKALVDEFQNRIFLNWATPGLPLSITCKLSWTGHQKGPCGFRARLPAPWSRLLHSVKGTMEHIGSRFQDRSPSDSTPLHFDLVISTRPSVIRIPSALVRGWSARMRELFPIASMSGS